MELVKTTFTVNTSNGPLTVIFTPIGEIPDTFMAGYQVNVRELGHQTYTTKEPSLNECKIILEEIAVI